MASGARLRPLQVRAFPFPPPGAAPRYNQAVTLSGLSAKPELNGRRGVVKGVLDRQSGRVAVDVDTDGATVRLAIKPANLAVQAAEEGGGAEGAAEGEATEGQATEGEATEGEAAYATVYEYAEGDCIFIDNLAVAHRAAPAAHEAATVRGLRILHRTTIKAPRNFDPPYGLPWMLNVAGPNPLGGKGVWQGGGLGFRWDETIPMQN